MDWTERKVELLELVRIAPSEPELLAVEVYKHIAMLKMVWEEELRTEVDEASYTGYNQGYEKGWEDGQ